VHGGQITTSFLTLGEDSIRDMLSADKMYTNLVKKKI
jgi:hypothetical protein